MARPWSLRNLNDVSSEGVTALDATPRFCRVAEELTRRTGLADRVEVVQGDALSLPFDDAVFDLAWTQAVGQNVADKRRFVFQPQRRCGNGRRQRTRRTDRPDGQRR